MWFPLGTTIEKYGDCLKVLKKDYDRIAESTKALRDIGLFKTDGPNQLRSTGGLLYQMEDWFEPGVADWPPVEDEDPVSMETMEDISLILEDSQLL